MTLENPNCSIGNISSFMVGFPASHVSFRGVQAPWFSPKKTPHLMASQPTPPTRNKEIKPS